MTTKLIHACFLIITLMGCKSASMNDASSGAAPEANRAVGDELKLEASTLEAGARPAFATKEDHDKKIIKTAYLSFEVANYEEARRKVDQVIADHKAYIVNESFQNTDYQKSNNMSIRVPAVTFNALLEALPKLAKRVEYQNVDSQDVTEEFMDVETRLRNKRKVEQTYLKLLGRTTSIDEILSIENKLGEIRAEIESAEGRLRYLNHQVSYSTISLHIFQRIEYKFVPEETPNFLQRLLKSLDGGWRGLVAFFLFVIALWPLWLVTALGVYLWFHIRRRRRLAKIEKKKKGKKKPQRGEKEEPLLNQPQQ